jgi:hypothetical protein
LTIIVPEYIGRRDVPRCADQRADRQIAQWNDPWANCK